jgi:hypothetical protein
MGAKTTEHDFSKEVGMRSSGDDLEGIVLSSADT